MYLFDTFSVSKEAGHNTMKTIYIPLSKIDEKIKFQKIKIPSYKPFDILLT